MVPRERGRTLRKDELRLKVREGTADFLVVRAKRAPLTPMDDWDDRPATGHAQYQRWCELCVADVSCKAAQQRC